jgi:hypothetical protein
MESFTTKLLDSKQYDKIDGSVRPSEDDNESNVTLLEKKHQRWKAIGENSPHRHYRSAMIRLLYTLLVITSMSSLIYISSKVHRIEANLTHGVNLGNCGKSDSVEEARALGCVFDPMSWVWVRPECYDAELIEDFMNSTDWTWHTEPKLSPESVVPLDEIYRGDHPKLFISKMYHTVHCSVRTIPFSFHL